MSTCKIIISTFNIYTCSCAVMQVKCNQITIRIFFKSNIVNIWLPTSKMQFIYEIRHFYVDFEDIRGFSQN